MIADRDLYARDPAKHLAQLQAASERITRETEALPSPRNPQLAHYLAKCSFDKALAWLEGER